MSSILIKLMLLVFGVGSLGATTYFLEQAWRADQAFSHIQAPDDLKVEGEVQSDGAAEHGATTASHSGGHGEAAPASGHGEAAPAGGHGGAPAPASVALNHGTVVLSLEQTFANVLDEKSSAHSLMMKLDLELFDEGQRLLVDQRSSVLKSTIIEVARSQNYEQLMTLAGKAYFKELLVSRMNEALRKAAVRDVHFNAFYMQ